MTLSDLADRIEGLEGPCRETDALIAVAIDWKPEDWEEGDTSPRQMVEKHGIEWFMGRVQSYQSLWSRIPNPTASIDAALSLVPKDHAWEVGGHSGLYGASCWPINEDRQDALQAATPALALAVAALRSLAHKE